ncbi:hypothetical protein HBB16_06780 [Pseudonocardia sp. MCCB 268]|nr:hypothetical protein [Pseudonocardia cytotoxica]
MPEAGASRVLAVVEREAEATLLSPATCRAPDRAGPAGTPTTCLSSTTSCCSRRRRWTSSCPPDCDAEGPRAAVGFRRRPAQARVDTAAEEADQ